MKKIMTLLLFMFLVFGNTNAASLLGNEEAMKELERETNQALEERLETLRQEQQKKQQASKKENTNKTINNANNNQEKQTSKEKYLENKSDIPDMTDKGAVEIKEKTNIEHKTILSQQQTQSLENKLSKALKPYIVNSKSIEEMITKMSRIVEKIKKVKDSSSLSSLQKAQMTVLYNHSYKMEIALKKIKAMQEESTSSY